MFFRIKKPSKIQTQIAAFIIAAALGCFSYIEHAMAGGGSPPQKDALTKALRNHLVEKGVCANVEKCGEMLHMLHEGTTRIYLNMYGQTDTVLASYVTAFFVEKGIKITEGMPITLTVYPKPKSEYMGFTYGFYNEDQLLTLEINK